ncbi:MAG: serine/threonine protein kinase [Gemmatimonadetes bacterium]|nr:serine/threonine protein kinase [Gemmatimonadota bacterium]
MALKVLPEEYAADLALRARFLQETRTAASFSHPNIVPVHAVEERPRLIAYAMGFIEGESVSQRVARSGPLTVREIVRLLQDVGYALAYAHGRGVVHRDIKPENIMLERATGRALLMDFGISRVMEKRASAGLTRVGEVVGTPEYMSPEQAAGDEVDGRSDLFSLGLVAWYAVTGRTAMTGETTQEDPRQAVDRVGSPGRDGAPRAPRPALGGHRPVHREGAGRPLCDCRGAGGGGRRRAAGGARHPASRAYLRPGAGDDVTDRARHRAARLVYRATAGGTDVDDRRLPPGGDPVFRGAHARAPDAVRRAPPGRGRLHARRDPQGMRAVVDERESLRSALRTIARRAGAGAARW